MDSGGAGGTRLIGLSPRGPIPFCQIPLGPLPASSNYLGQIIVHMSVGSITS